MSAFIVYRPTTLGGGGGSSGVTSINADGSPAQLLTVGTAGTNFAIVDAGSGSHVFNLPTASASNRGALSSADWTTFNAKQSTVSFAAVGSTPNANGGGISGGVITLQPADGTNPGVVTANTQTIAGGKSFTSATSFAGGNAAAVGIYLGTDVGTGLYRPAVDQLNIAAAGSIVANFGTSGLAITGNISATNFSGSSSGTNTGNVTLGTASGLSLTGQVLSLGLASAGVTGALSGTDWSTFNGKQATGNYATSGSGDVAWSAPSGAGPVTTSYSGTVPLNKGGTGQTTKAPAFDALQPMTTSGDVIYGGASGTGTRLGANATATNKYLQSVSSGVPAWAQVAFSDLSGSVAAGQMPALTGDVTTSAGAVATTVAKISGTTVSGTTGSTNVVFSASPTLSGTTTFPGSTVVSSAGKLGLGATPSSWLDVNGDYSIRSNANVTGSGTLDNMDVSGKSFIEFNVSTTLSITGTATAQNGQIIHISNIGTGTITFVNGSGSSTKQFDIGANRTMVGRGFSTFIYSNQGSAWFRQIAVS